MSTVPNRRGVLAALGLAPLATAAGATPATAIGRLRAGFTGGTTFARARGLDAALAQAAPLDRAIPEPLAQLAERLDEATRSSAPPGVDARTARFLAALAEAFPAEIAAHRSFAPHLRRRLYAELLVRESGRIGAAGEPPRRPPASPGPGA